MKNKASKLFLILILSTVTIYGQWLPGGATSSQDIYRTGRVGLNMSSAPTLFPLEVNGPIGLTFGNYLGVSGGSLTHRKLLEVNWDAANPSTVGDYIAFYTPGQAGANGINGVEKMRITMNGKFSLGAGALPEAKLHVHQDELLGNAQNSSLLLTRISGNYGVLGSKFIQSTWLIRHSNGTAWTTTFLRDGLSIDGLFLDASTNNCNVKTWWNRDPNNDSQSWGTGIQTYLGIDQGKVGVNINYANTTLANRGRFQVDETVAYNGATATKAFVVKTDHSADYAYCMVADVNRDETVAFTVNNRNFNGTGQTHMPFSVKGNGQTVISAALTENMSSQPPLLVPVFLIQDASSTNGDINFKIYKSGTTVIGQKRTWGIHNDAKLAIDGKVTCKEVIVTQQGWADFVFDKNYKLMPLVELENYYKENHHLPDVPSTKEISENGNDLGKTDAILLQKIEELTLYLVELKKEIEKLKSKN